MNTSSDFENFKNLEIPLKDGTLGLAPLEWLQKHLRLEHMSYMADEKLMLAKDHVLYLDILFE